ncbi:hypothetical protein ZEAMMB73_Zm00001d010591 [Zea mays]|jgi:hypothetical protein|uniref:Uncharacterized protein n=1 Tax=Zea mays TaxID=4577 RepID=K7V0N1_MAIZE|nr:hypothetical protein ZEAMMB73_Zm00001d010591 [Zea mays]
MDVVVVAGSSDDHRRRRKGSSDHVVAQLLESPLPTPRRSCCGRPADTPAARRGCADASPRRGHVPFKWESSPGVPKSAAAAAEREVPLPKPPPGRCGTCHAARARARAYHHHSTATADSSSSDRQDDDTFSDALDRVSSSDRLALAAISARLSAIDGAFGSRRSPSFIMDRFLPAANAIATTSADKHPRRRPSSRRSKSKRDRDREAEAAATATARAIVAMHVRRRALPSEQPIYSPQQPQCEREDAAAQAQLPSCAKEDARGEQTPPKACGFMFFFPWSAKPVHLGFQRSPARPRTPRGDVASVTTTASASPPRRSVTLGDALEKERKVRDGSLSHWYDEKSGSGKEWGMALLGTSKRYCADARKALSRLTRSGMDSGDSPRIGRERSSSKHKHKQAASMPLPRATSVKLPPLSPPSESWLSNARRSNASITKIDGTCDRRESPIAHT